MKKWNEIVIEENYLQIMLKIEAYLNDLYRHADGEMENFYRKTINAFRAGAENMNDSKYESDDKEISDKDIERYVFDPIAYHLSGEFDKENAKKAAALLKKAHPIMKKYLR